MPNDLQDFRRFMMRRALLRKDATGKTYAQKLLNNTNPPYSTMSRKGCSLRTILLFATCFAGTILPVGANPAQAINADVEAADAVASCRNAGFDPWQLSCETCNILPYDSSSPVISKCLSCCQSYKTLEKRTHAYQGAILLHSNAAGFFPEIDSFVDEDLEKIAEQKGEERFRVIKFPGGGRGMFNHPQPSAILWFDEKPPKNEDSAGTSIFELQNLAKETIILDGWKRDEVREMLLAILPDKQ